jgi:hypothetical protein
MNRLPLSPPSEPISPPSTDTVPLSSSVRTTPIHAALPDIRVPSESLPSHRYHPVTCTPLDVLEVRSQVQELCKEYPTSVAARKAQEAAALEVKQRLIDAERKKEDIQKTMKRKTEEREMERKVFSKIKKERDGKA